MENNDTCNNLQDLLTEKTNSLADTHELYIKLLFEEEMLKLIEHAEQNDVKYYSANNYKAVGSEPLFMIQNKKFQEFLNRLDKSEYLTIDNDYFNSDYFFLLNNNKLLVINSRGGYNLNDERFYADSYLTSRTIDISNGCFRKYGYGRTYNYHLNESYDPGVVSYFCDKNDNALSDNYYAAESMTTLPETEEISQILNPVTMKYLVDKIVNDKKDVKAKKRTI